MSTPPTSTSGVCLLRCTSRNGVIFDQEVVLKPKRTVMCLYPEGGIDAVELVEAANNEEVGVVGGDAGVVAFILFVSNGGMAH